MEGNDNKIQYGVSICISAFHAVEYLYETLVSINKQTWFTDHKNWEVIIGIDGCTDTLKYCQELIRKNEFSKEHYKFYMMDTNKGTYITSNTIMLNIAKYEWLVRFDADDIMLPNMISEIMAVATDNTELIRFKLRNFYDTTYVRTGKDNIKNIYTAFGQIAIRKSVFKEYGGYMPWRCSGDYELLARIERFVKKIQLDKVLLNRRVTNNSLTRSKETGYGSNVRKDHERYANQTSKKISKDKAAIVPETNGYTSVDDIATISNGQ